MDMLLVVILIDWANNGFDNKVDEYVDEPWEKLLLSKREIGRKWKGVVEFSDS